ncbi:MAG: hypothetical protein K2X03_16610 [Bryobacteraceae bacterium]|nr:hypothetical protein [Bryobacteraceae bacterium]
MPAKPSAIPLKCPHCSRWLARDRPEHRCVPPTEREVVGHLTGDLNDAWIKLRAAALQLGPQEIHASAKAVMFSRSTCYLFVRTRKSALELCLFLPEPLAHPLVKRVQQVSARKHAHTILLQHEDQIEAPLTEWMGTAWGHCEH